ncbi:MAG: deoxyguanosinetriphosphate triphosphohydrolase [Acutalibacteraceae bacterium]|nr:deoxyguanosinetriphosphate triphosphohydrolase [Acutalibacteraceae bacterium]
MDSIRRRIEETEHIVLCEMASFSDKSVGRKVYEEPSDIRTDYQRDRDRIIHCKAFRRLKHKTQVFLSPESDHYRTRLTHTLEVSQIARTIARALRLNEDLTEAIALGHDLGHTPFGHAGERALNELAPFEFNHYTQSVRVCEKLEKSGKGLNLTGEVLNGILCHTRGEEASTLEGRIVKISDRIAYINHDIDDAIRGGIIDINDIPKEIRDFLGQTKTQRITTLVNSVIKNSTDGILMDTLTKKHFDALHDYLFESVYRNPKAKSEETKVYDFVKGLYDYYTHHPELLPDEYKMICDSEGVERAVVDYIAGMTDHYAVVTYQNLYIPGSWQL